jgi:hypothetical protein
MKKLAIALAAALMVAGFASAQTNVANTSAQAQVLTKVSGKLELVQGVIAIKSGSKTYLVPELQRFVGFVKGVEEGGTVAVEGYESAVPFATDVVFLHLTKLTVGGKDYDLSQYAQGKGGRGMMRGKMGGRW